MSSGLTQPIGSRSVRAAVRASLVCRPSITSAAMRARSRRARAPSRSSRASRCRSRRSTTNSSAREIVGRVESDRRAANGLFEVRIALAAETVGRRCRAAPQHAVRQHVAARGRGAARRRAAGRARCRRSAARATGSHGLRRRVGARRAGLDLLGAQAAGPAAAAARGAGAGASRKAASTTSRTTTGSPTRPIRRSRHASRRSRRRCAAASGRAPRPLRAEPVGRSRRHAPRRSPPPRAAGIDTVMVAPMIVGLRQLPPAGAGASRPSPSSPIPAMGGAARIAPPLLLGKLFRLHRRRRGGVPQPWRPLRLLPRYLPCARAQPRWRSATGCAPACRCRPAA